MLLCCDHASITSGLSRERSLSNPNERSEEHTSELQSHLNLVCRLLLEKQNMKFGVGSFPEKNGIPQIERAAPAAHTPGGESAIDIRGVAAARLPHRLEALCEPDARAP